MLDVNFKAVKVPKIAAWPLLSRLQFLRPVMRPASLDNKSLAQKTQNPKLITWGNLITSNSLRKTTEENIHQKSNCRKKNRNY